MNRPARVDKATAGVLDQEYRAARWTYHRLLDFEAEHQAILDATAEQCAPGIERVGRIIARLRRRRRWADRATSGNWRPKDRPELLRSLQKRLADLRKQRNADVRWKRALEWADEVAPGAPERGKARRKSGETDAEYEKRVATRRNHMNRREAYRHTLYQDRRIHWSTWNALLRSVDQARKDMLKERKKGTPAKMRRPRWDDPSTLTLEPAAFRVVERGDLWWIVEVRVFGGWVPFRAKFGNWHDLPDDAELKLCKLTRRKSGRGWKYSASITVDGMPDTVDGSDLGTVALDWGHREYGHPREREGLRVMTWWGDDGASGEVILPRECRDLLDKLHKTHARVDQAYDARREAMGLQQRSRHRYRSALMLSGARTEEQSAWLQWEARYERRMESMRKRIQNIRKETYTKAVRELRRRYKRFAIEDETIAGKTGHRELDIEEMSRHRKRQNRELSARYDFVQLCERFGGEVIPVTARNSTRECPDCGQLSENNADLMVACNGCGRVRDKDYGAARVILARAQGPLADAAE